MPELGRLQLALEILAYLVENSDAQDTMAGIIEWWLLEQQIRTQTFAVREAVAELVARNLILQRKGKDSQLHYRVNNSKMDEVVTMLAQREIKQEPP